ncbi:hypothetical protein PUNSTDRAFT_24189, partial [Punctularia strigosozonata HHB-11173 SS5]
SDDDTNSDSAYTDSVDDDDSDVFADDESDSDDEDIPMLLPSTVGRLIVKEYLTLHRDRYQAPRTGLPRAPGHLRHTLDVMKEQRPDHFRNDLRVSPAVFDRIVAEIEHDPIFSNHSHHAQMPVEEQLAIVLFRFGHNGNSAGVSRIAKWAGVGKGTVENATRRVMTAVLRRSFMDQAVRLPTTVEKEEAKRWVERKSCDEWRDGWLFVDGTLVPLYDRPHWYGESYYDRKCNYSLNIQVISLPNLQIIDFGYGFTGSTHDSTAWKETRVYREHEMILEGQEWIWADSAYPVKHWVIAPYKK